MQRDKYLYINSRDDLLRIDISKIIYFEADGNYTNIILSNKLKSVVSMNLLQMQKLISDTLKDKATIFVRLGKKYIVNHTYVYHINIPYQKLTLSDGLNFVFSLEISKDALRQLKDLLVKANSFKAHNE